MRAIIGIIIVVLVSVGGCKAPAYKPHPAYQRLLLPTDKNVDTRYILAPEDNDTDYYLRPLADYPDDNGGRPDQTPKKPKQPRTSGHKPTTPKKPSTSGTSEENYPSDNDADYVPPPSMGSSGDDWEYPVYWQH